MAIKAGSYTAVIRVSNLEIATDVKDTSSDGYALIVDEEPIRTQMELSMNKIHKIYLEDPS
jgi:SepF-like predicted cell division protein (DUF552 family)